MSFQAKPEQQQSYRWIMQGLLSPRQMPNPAPLLNNNLRHLPRAVSLERSSHGVTQSKMLTKFHTLRHENKERLLLVHCPAKLSKRIYNKLTENCQQSQNIEHKILLPHSLHTTTKVLYFEIPGA
jgi:hypothetical protein